MAALSGHPHRHPGTSFAPPFAPVAESMAFGEFLRGARTRRGLTLEQISRETKIPQHHLDSLEHGNLSAVPGGMYRRGEIRAYAQVVGIDQAVALAALARALEASHIEQHVPRPTPVGISVDWRNVAIAAVVAATLGLAVWLTTHDRPPAATTVPVERSGPQQTVAPASRIPAPPADSAAAGALLPGMIDASRGAATEPVAASSRDAALVIETEPPGAQVTVDGIGWGRTPVTIRHLPAGDKKVRVTLSGHTTEERRVRIDNTGRVTLSIPLVDRSQGQ